MIFLFPAAAGVQGITIDPEKPGSCIGYNAAAFNKKTQISGKLITCANSFFGVEYRNH